MSLGFPNRSDTNRPVVPQKDGQWHEISDLEGREIVHVCCENKGVDQLLGYCTAESVSLFLHMQ